MAEHALSVQDLGMASTIEALGERNNAVSGALDALEALQSERKLIESRRGRLHRGPVAAPSLASSQAQAAFSPSKALRGSPTSAVSPIFAAREASMDVLSFLDQHVPGQAHSSSIARQAAEEVEKLKSEARGHLRSIETLQAQSRRTEAENTNIKRNMLSRERVLEQAIESSEWIVAKTKRRLEEWEREKHMITQECLVARQEAVDARTRCDNMIEQRARDKRAWGCEKEGLQKAVAFEREQHRRAAEQLDALRTRAKELEAATTVLREAAPAGGKAGTVPHPELVSLEQRVLAEEVTALRQQVKGMAAHARTQAVQERLFSQQLGEPPLPSLPLPYPCPYCALPLLTS
jgi:hypothetical protein